jgi:sugar phosphate isomerase/epimerase
MEMKANIKSFMRVGLIHFMAYPETMKGEGPIVETLTEILKDDYFDFLEISWIKDDQTRENARDLIKQCHIGLAYGSQPRVLTTGLDINSLDESISSKALAILKEGIDEAYYLGAEGFALMSGKYPGEENEDAAMDVLIRNICELCSYARQKGNMPVILEVFDRNLDKKSLIGPTPSALYVAQQVTKQFDNFGLMVDLSHIPQLHETIEESLLPVKDYIKHIHIGNCVVKDKNSPYFGDQHPRFGIEGGENDVPELKHFLKVLFDIGYLGDGKRPAISFEVKPMKGESSELIIANAKRTLNQAWAELKL